MGAAPYAVCSGHHPPCSLHRTYVIISMIVETRAALIILACVQRNSHALSDGAYTDMQSFYMAVCTDICVMPLRSFPNQHGSYAPPPSYPPPVSALVLYLSFDVSATTLSTFDTCVQQPAHYGGYYPPPPQVGK